MPIAWPAAAATVQDSKSERAVARGAGLVEEVGWHRHEWHRRGWGWHGRRGRHRHWH
jgi:hypothetical protein